ADFSAGMLRLADEKRRAHRFGSRVLPVLGDAMAVPAPDGSMDAIVTGFTLRNVADLPTVFAECFRALRPGGRLAILELTPLKRASIPGFEPLFDFYFGLVVPIIGALVSGQGFAYRYLPRSVRVFPEADALATMLRDAGFAEVRYQLLALGTLALHVAEKAGNQTPSPVQAGGLDVREVTDAREWNALLASVPNAHILQSWEWGELKRETGWLPRRLAFARAGQVVAAASVSRRPLGPTGFGFAYCQKGPALDYADTALFAEVLEHLENDARTHRCIFLKVDPDVEATQAAGAATLRRAGFVPAAEQVQTRSTVITDLRGSEQDLMSRMGSTWRRYIRKAAREGVNIRRGAEADLSRFYELNQETEKRQGFIIRPLWYYRDAYRCLSGAGLAELFMAEVDGRAEATLVACQIGKRAWYLYGAASDVGLKSHAAHLLQWHTMQWARERGCESYDMWGAPDDPTDKDDPLSGVYYFKQGFGGRHVRMVGAYDYVVYPALYHLWNTALPQYVRLSRRLRGEGAAALDGVEPRSTGHE
ncbi:MAG TPA: peptidoglycan bridge formation glycyltransferase FemA/FemB family protein, partial [Chloroflexota bacterium]|nr:peptidoglycan bridge formation glycyltransferase FemA/FemB family protein [Chloroflexota bacterium]